MNICVYLSEEQFVVCLIKFVRRSRLWTYMPCLKFANRLRCWDGVQTTSWCCAFCVWAVRLLRYWYWGGPVRFCCERENYDDVRPDKASVSTLSHRRLLQVNWLELQRSHASALFPAVVVSPHPFLSAGSSWVSLTSSGRTGEGEGER